MLVAISVSVNALLLVSCSLIKSFNSAVAFPAISALSGFGPNPPEVFAPITEFLRSLRMVSKPKSFRSCSSRLLFNAIKSAVSLGVRPLTSAIARISSESRTSVGLVISLVNSDITRGSVFCVTLPLFVNNSLRAPPCEPPYSWFNLWSSLLSSCVESHHSWVHLASSPAFCISSKSSPILFSPFVSSSSSWRFSEASISCVTFLSACAKRSL